MYRRHAAQHSAKAFDNTASAAQSIADLKARYPRIDDPCEAINFALSIRLSQFDALDFLQTWRDGAWDEIKQTYPEFLQQVAENEREATSGPFGLGL